jgi:hypothetical protein
MDSTTSAEFSAFDSGILDSADKSWACRAIFFACDQLQARAANVASGELCHREERELRAGSTISVVPVHD